MQTLLTTDPEEAAALLRHGEVVAFPTETVYGLGADALVAAAVGEVFSAKGRPADNPLIVHLSEPEGVTTVASEVPPLALRLMDRFWPGPLTLVLPRRSDLPEVVSGGLATVGVRVPAAGLALEFLHACRTPVVAPSANRSGRPSPTTWQAVLEDLDGRIAGILQGPPSARGVESTVVDCTGDPPLLLRPGAIPMEALRLVAPDLQYPGRDAAALRRSPGTRYRHYAPRAVVEIVDAPLATGTHPDRGYIGLELPASRYGLSQHCSDLAGYAHHLFDFFRRCDVAGLDRIDCQRVPDHGLGAAIMDRLRRAADG